MRSVVTRNGLGGRWAASPAIWLVLFGPASVLVIMQETATVFPTWWALPVSALTQHTVAGAVILALMSAARLVRPTVPAGVAVAIWVIGGVVRGIVSGLFVDAQSVNEPEYLYRILFWAVVAGVWIPLTVYTAAQLDRRSRLLSSVISLRAAIDVEHAEAEISEREREQRLAIAVRAAIAPVVAEIRQSLDAALAESRQPLATISDKIESVVGNVLDIVVHEPIGASKRQDSPRRLLAPLSAALTFDRSRPVFASSLVAIASAALLVPDSLRFGGVSEAVQTAAAIVIGAAFMAGFLTLVNRDANSTGDHTWQLALVIAISAMASVIVFLLTCNFPLQVFDVMRLFAIPISLVASAAVLTASVGLGLSNQYAVPEERRLINELTALRDLALAREEATREQFTSLLHGPVLGRLSACVMALNFHAAGGGGTAASRAEVAAQVISHLDLVSADLEAMTVTQNTDKASR